MQLTDLEVRAIQVGDLELAARRRSQCFREGGGASIVKINAGDRVIRRRRQRLFQQIGNAARGVELNDAIALRILYVVAEHRRAGFALCRRHQQRGEVRAVKYVVPENQRRRRAAQE